MESRSAQSSQYDLVARALHWLIAAAVIVLLTLGLLHDPLGDAFGWRVMPLHKSLGMSVFALTILRLGWRLTHRPPPLPADMPPRERVAAQVVHVAFYALTLTLPVLGYLLSSAGPFPLAWFDVPVPKAHVVKDSLVHVASEKGHVVGGFLMTALVVLHVAAALRHHFVLKDGLLARMAALGRARGGAA